MPLLFCGSLLCLCWSAIIPCLPYSLTRCVSARLSVRLVHAVETKPIYTTGAEL